MSETVVINPKYKNILADNGFGSLDSFLQFSAGQIMDKNSRRCVYRFTMKDPETSRKRVFYLKQFHKSSFENEIHKIVSYGLPRSEAKTEWMNARLLIESGFNTIPLVAYGERKRFGFEDASFFLSEEIPNAHCLEEWFMSCTDKSLRKKVLDALAETVRAMHRHKFSYPDLYLKHIFIFTRSLQNGTVRFALLDLHRLREKRRVSFRDNVRDLAALCFSALPILKEDEIVYLLNTYLKDKVEQKRWKSAIAERIDKLKKRRSHAKGVVTRTCVSCDGAACLFINEEYYTDFAELGIISFDDLYNFPTNNDKLTDNPGRTVETISIISRKKRYTLYIKKHEPVPGKQVLKDHREIRDHAYQEWRNHQICMRLGIDVPEPVAWGYRRSPHQSCLVTREVENSMSLEKLIQMGCLPTDFTVRSECIAKLAGIARKLHNGGYCHKDFYTGHILVQSKSLTDFTNCVMYLIDLQRIASFALLRQRWRVKDISQLLFTAQYPEIRRKDKIRFIHYYLGKRKLSTSDRRLLRQIEAKANRIRKHIPQVLRRKNIDSWDQVR